MSQPGSRNNRVRALSVRALTPPPQGEPTDDDRHSQPRERLPGSRTNRTRVQLTVAVPSPQVTELTNGGGGINATGSGPVPTADGAGEQRVVEVTVTEVVFDEIDEATGQNIVVEAAVPREEVEFMLEKQSLIEPEAAATEHVEADLLANYSMVARNRTWKEWAAFMRPGLLVVGFTFLSALGRVMFINQLPFIMSDFFGGPQQAAMVQTAADATRAALAMLVVPIYGSLLDTIGRRPFFIAQGVLNTLPATFLIATPSNPVPAMVCYEVSQLLSTTYYLAFITDMYSDGRDRGKVMAIVTGVSSLSSLIGIIGATVSPMTSLWIALVLMLLRVPFACFGIPESLDPAQRKDFSWKLININPMPAIRSISCNRVLVLVTFIVASLLIASIAAGELMSYYLQVRVNWTETDGYYASVEGGIVGPLLLLVIYPILSKHVRPSRIVLIAYLSVLVSLISLILLFKKWEVFAITFVFMSTINIGVPPLLAIFTTAGDGDDQGQRLAGILAVMDLMNALIPLAVGQAFSHIPSNLSWVTFVVCGVLALPGLAACAFVLPKWIANDRKQTLSKTIGDSTATAH